MNKELPTQVDKACENTSDREIPVIVKFTKNLRDISKQTSVVICVENLSILQILYSNLYKVPRLKKNTATVEDDTHTEYTLNEAY